MEPAIAALGALVLGPFFGGLIAGVDRKVSARLQGRFGPPLIQPFYDILKLLGKEAQAVNAWQPACALLYLLGAAGSMVVFAVGGNLLVIFFLMTFTASFLVMGAQAAPSPYSRLGAGRELLQALVCEPVLLLVFTGFYQAAGSFEVLSVWRHSEALLWRMPLAYAALFPVLLIKLRKSPLDISASPHAHQELVRGTLTEYSGPFLALLEAGHWCETVLLLMILSLFAGGPSWGTAVLVAATYVAAVVADNVLPRLTWGWMMRSAWVTGLILAFLNLLWLHGKGG